MALDLERQGRAFAASLSDLLNGTICDGIRLTAVLHQQTASVRVGYDLTQQQWDVRRGIPLRLKNRKPSAFLVVSYRLCADPENEYLAVRSSTLALTLSEDLSAELFHVDYERDKGDGYPEAHLQIVAQSDHWQALCSARGGKGRELGRLHFPVGGRRFRPTLEDLIEFLIVERLVEPRPDWERPVEAGRRDFQERQLRAAVRRNPEVARDALRAFDETAARA